MLHSLFMSGGAYSAGDLVVLGISHSARLGSFSDPGLIGEEDIDEEDDDDGGEEEEEVSPGSDLIIIAALTFAMRSTLISSTSANLCVCKMLHVNWSISSPSSRDGLLHTGHFQMPRSPLALR